MRHAVPLLLQRPFQCPHYPQSLCRAAGFKRDLSTASHNKYALIILTPFCSNSTPMLEESNGVPSHLAFQRVSILLDVMRGIIRQQPVNDVQPNVIGKLKSAYCVCKTSVPQELHCSERTA